MKIMLVLAGFVLMIAYCVIGTSDMAQAEEVLGTGTDSLLGGDLTDPEDDGEAESDDGYDAIFSANDEPGFGGGEFAFNVFDNRLGPSNDKWCCGRGGGIPDEGLHVTAEFEEQLRIDTLHRIFSERCSSEGPYSVGSSGVERRRGVYDHLCSRRDSFGRSDWKSSFLRQGKITTFKKPGIDFFGMLLLTPHRTRLGRTFKLAKLSSSAMTVFRRTESEARNYMGTPQKRPISANIDIF